MTPRLGDFVLIFVATILGVLVYYAADPWPVLILLGALLVVTLMFRLAVTKLLSGQDAKALRLVIATALIFTWYGFLFAIIALVTFTTLGITFALMQLIQTEGSRFFVPEAESSTTGGVVIGALSTLIASAFFDEIRKPGGALWPPAQFQAYLAKVYGGHPAISGRKWPALYRPLFLDETNGGAGDWRFIGAIGRVAAIVPQLDRLSPRSDAD